MSDISAPSPARAGATAVDTDLQTHYVESAEKRRQRLSTGVLVIVVGVILLALLTSTTGSAKFALSDAFDAIQLPTVALPGVGTVAVCAILCLLAGAGFVSGRLRGRLHRGGQRPTDALRRVGGETTPTTVDRHPHRRGRHHPAGAAVLHHRLRQVRPVRRL